MANILVQTGVKSAKTFVTEGFQAFKIKATSCNKFQSKWSLLEWQHGGSNSSNHVHARTQVEEEWVGPCKQNEGMKQREKK